MPRCLTLTPHLSLDDLDHRYRESHDPVERTHWQMVRLVAQGHSCPAVATLLGYGEDWVRTIVHRYNAEGAAGIADRRHANRGHPPLLSPALREELGEMLDGDPPDGGLWTSPKVAAWMHERLGRPVSRQRAWEAMRSLGFTLQQPRTRAATADPAAQEAFKKGGSNRAWTRSARPIPTPR